MHERLGTNASPYAYRNRLGWWIVGPIINGNNQYSISCHQVAVRDAFTSQIALHHFGIKDSIKGITLEEVFKIMYNNDISEPALPSSRIMMNSNEVSAEDQKFLYIMEEGTVKKDDHYVVPLPFRDQYLVIPKNPGIKKAQMFQKKILER